MPKSVTIQCPSCDADIRVSVHGKKSEPKEKSPYYDMARDLVEEYKTRFVRYITDDPSKQPAIDYAKCVKLAMNAIKVFGLMRCAELLTLYFNSDDQFYQKNGWSLELFLSTSVLNKLNLYSQ